MPDVRGYQLPSLHLWRIQTPWLRRSLLVLLFVPQTLLWLAYVPLRLALWCGSLLVVMAIVLGAELACRIAVDWARVLLSCPRCFRNTWRGMDAPGAPPCPTGAGPLCRAVITEENRGWKGTIGRLGETFIIWRTETPAPAVRGKHRVFGRSHLYLSAGTFRVEPLTPLDLLRVVRASPRELQDWCGRRRVERALDHTERA